MQRHLELVHHRLEQLACRLLGLLALLLEQLELGRQALVPLLGQQLVLVLQQDLLLELLDQLGS